MNATVAPCLVLPAPAKLNLFLHVVGRRDDGYHLLQTVFQLLDVADQIGLCRRDDQQILRRTELAGVPAEQDLVVKAARLLQTHCRVSQGVEISVEKCLPMGGGLGGGSSNAATVLVGLNQLWGCGLTQPQLAALGLQLGADVPVFINGQSAWAEGVGEQLAPVELPNRWFVVLIPQINVATAKVFADPQLRRDCPPITIRDFLAGQGSNVCEPVVSAAYPEVAAALQDLGHYGAARLTGTGACVFAGFNDPTSAHQVMEKLSAKWHGFVAQGVNRSLLYKEDGSLNTQTVA